MASAEVEAPPGLPDYLLDPNATLKDHDSKWRYGKAPDYSNTRKVYEQTKTKSHEAASLPNLVENLVKNWEVEASFKPDINDWRTIDRPNYTFAINGGPPQDADHMLKVGTYNAIIAANDYYCPESSDFASSHKTFKRMMPTFAWEVLEVYSGPPVVAFKWRHWGTMKRDYVGLNDKGEKITAKAHGGSIDIQGITVAKVDDRVRLQSVETWFDPMEMFRQISPTGNVTRTIHVATPGQDITIQLHGEDEDGESTSTESVNKSVTIPTPGDGVTIQLPAKEATPNESTPVKVGKGAEEIVLLDPRVPDVDGPPREDGVSDSATAGTDGVTAVHEEMSGMTPAACPFLARQD